MKKYYLNYKHLVICVSTILIPDSWRITPFIIAYGCVTETSVETLNLQTGNLE